MIQNNIKVIEYIKGDIKGIEINNKNFGKKIKLTDKLSTNDIQNLITKKRDH